MNDYLREMISKRAQGIHTGIPSYCTASGLVIEALLEHTKKKGGVLLLEATANQVNQFGGYTGMLPADFRDYVYELARKTGVSSEQIILGGDHLGPLVWSDEPEESAMKKAEELVRLFVLAGYKKIHLDTSMKLADDGDVLEDEIIARRGARLYKVCEEAYQELKKKNPEEVRPTYIIGSEVPIPGGAQDNEELAVTKPEAVEKTLRVYRDEFEKAGFPEAFENIVGIVVQPGVEFGDESIHQYHKEEAKELCSMIKKMPGIVLEGHSTDYQSPVALREMVADEIAILKVGPALTFAVREGLFALSHMEKEVLPKKKWTNFPEILESVMVDQPKQWKKHYHGTPGQLKLKRKYSLSDRSRYYMSRPEISDAMDKLFHNLKNVEFPLGMVHQYMPMSYAKVRDGKLKATAMELVKDYVVNVAEDYDYAVSSGNHFDGGSR